jgi:hypothetical protein
MELVDPDFTRLFVPPDDGEYRVLSLAPAIQFAAGRPKRPAMTADQYRRLEEGRLLLGGILAIEEAYDVTVGNFLELEETVLRLAALELAQRRPDGRDEHFDTARRSCHRALANLLSASRAFQDHSQRLASSIGGGASDSDLAAVRDSFSRAYDGAQGYRFMSALRNHAQHFGVSVSGVAHLRVSADPSAGGSEQYVTTAPYILLSELRANGQFKSAILLEAESIAHPGPRGEPIVPLTLMARQYIAGLSSVMADIRSLYADREEIELNTLYSAYYNYSGWFAKGAPVGMHVAPEPNPDGTVNYFGTDAHFKARTLREVNGELSLLTRTTIRQ